MAKVVAGKGRAAPGAVGWVIEQIRRLGCGRHILQADGEPAQRAFIKDMIDEVCRTSNIGVAPAHTSARGRFANGAVEKAIGDVKAQVRIMMRALKGHIGAVKVSELVVEWLVPYAAEPLTGAHVSRDGMSPH